MLYIHKEKNITTMIKSTTWLITFSLLVIAIACNTGSKSSSSNSVTANWEIGIQTWTFRMFTLEQTLKKADSAGVRSIEAFWGQKLGAGLDEGFGITMSPAARAKLKEWLQQSNIRIRAMGVISPATREDWIKAFELAKEFGLSYITSEPRKNLWDMIDSLAGAYNIPVAIHEHPRPNPYWHPDSVLAAIKGHRNIGACADLGHWARSGLDPVTCLKQLDGHVLGVHLKDIKTFNDTRAADTPVSKGVLNYPAIFQELYRQKFKGMLSIEQESNWYNNLADVTNTVNYYRTETAKLK
jgi:sugar phosphate isomerase/epimerase